MGGRVHIQLQTERGRLLQQQLKEEGKGEEYMVRAVVKIIESVRYIIGRREGGLGGGRGGRTNG